MPGRLLTFLVRVVYTTVTLVGSLFVAEHYLATSGDHPVIVPGVAPLGLLFIWLQGVGVSVPRSQVVAVRGFTIACLIGGLWFNFLCVAFDYSLGGSFGIFDPVVRKMVNARIGRDLIGDHDQHEDRKRPT